MIHWGQVIAQGTPEELRSNPWVAARRTGDASQDARDRTHRHVLRRDAGAVRRRRSRVAPGEAVALLGPNGAGKTTMLRSILGLTPARSGAIRFGGQARSRKSATHDIARAGIGWVPTTGGSFPRSR